MTDQLQYNGIRTCYWTFCTNAPVIKPINDTPDNYPPPLGTYRGNEKS